MMFWSCIISFQPTPAVRAAAFTLFGTLSRFGSGPSEGPFFEQIQTNFVSLLLHLNEADPVVVVVCLPSFHRCLTCLVIFCDNHCTGLQGGSAETWTTNEV